MSSYELKHPIVQHYAGSIAYGTNLPTSDVDIRGIFCAEERQIRTPFYPVKEITLEDQEDSKLYELFTFLNLYLKGNPNILETLWVDESDILGSSSCYDLLRSKRNELLSSKVASSFSGYAISQLKRIKGHNKWINNPQPEKAPMHKDYLKLIQNFSGNKIMPREFLLDHLNGFNVVHYGGNTFGAVKNDGVNAVTESGDFNISCKQLQNNTTEEVPVFIFKYLVDQYKNDKEKHFNYWNWRNNRNEVRSAMEIDHGYDTKHAMHLVRLLRMGEEVLKGEGVIVKRPDAEELLDIRAGLWKYDDLIKWAEEKDKYIQKTLYLNTKLQRKPDIKVAAKVLMECQEICWYGDS